MAGRVGVAWPAPIAGVCPRRPALKCYRRRAERTKPAERLLCTNEVPLRHGCSHRWPRGEHWAGVPCEGFAVVERR